MKLLSIASLGLVGLAELASAIYPPIGSEVYGTGNIGPMNGPPGIGGFRPPIGPPIGNGYNPYPSKGGYGMGTGVGVGNGYGRNNYGKK